MNSLIMLAVIAGLLYLQYLSLMHLVFKSNLSPDSKRKWIIAFVLISGLASLIYFFTEYKDFKEDKY